MTKNILKKLTEQQFETIAGRFRALSEISRLKIIACLQNGEKSVTELVEETKLSQPNVSGHLNILLTTGLIGRRKEGNSVRYKIVDKSLSEICGIVCKNVCQA